MWSTGNKRIEKNGDLRGQVAIFVWAVPYF
ncbi:hypothetical protein W822_13605 [Advenella kashmirensis W13003]|uniref:Uncharacterized protein n=1 Tax=Advenella kashmirensis W13003 TaxID=1424334 RepID=V8QSP7_9BURK|nr:hypothetical protein W822_13605 [Advenella kashmirensis W13003]